MEIQKIDVEFGVKKRYHYNTGKERYWCIIDGRETDLNYATEKRAAEEALNFCRATYKIHTSYTGIVTDYNFIRIDI